MGPGSGEVAGVQQSPVACRYRRYRRYRRRRRRLSCLSSHIVFNLILHMVPFQSQSKAPVLTNHNRSPL